MRWCLRRSWYECAWWEMFISHGVQQAVMDVLTACVHFSHHHHSLSLSVCLFSVCNSRLCMSSFFFFIIIIQAKANSKRKWKSIRCLFPIIIGKSFNFTASSNVYCWLVNVRFVENEVISKDSISHVFRLQAMNHWRRKFSKQFQICLSANCNSIDFIAIQR